MKLHLSLLITPDYRCVIAFIKLKVLGILEAARWDEGNLSESLIQDVFDESKRRDY